MLEKAVPYIYPDGEIMLSLVTTLTLLPRVTRRFLTYLQIFDHYLEKYPPLPFEILVIFCGQAGDNRTFGDVIEMPKAMAAVVRHIDVPSRSVDAIKVAFNIYYFPEYVMCNITCSRRTASSS
jgi:hypothetical protein